MIAMDLVSVVLIFLDEGKFLDEAIASVVAQTYPHWELLLVDDGSTDGSTDVARRWADTQPARIRYLEHPAHANRGMSASRNLGVRHARGRYVAFIDGDDVWTADKLAEQVAILEREPEAAMVHGAVEHWRSWNGEPVERDVVTTLPVATDRLHRAPTALDALLASPHVTTTIALVRREALERAGGFEERFRGLYEDQVLYAKVVLQAPVFISSRCWYRWRQQPASSWVVGRRAHERARRRFLRWLGGHFRRAGVRDAALWRALRRERQRLRDAVRARALAGVRRWASERTAPARRILARAVPAEVHHRLRVWRYGAEYMPPVGQVHFGGLRRLTPITRSWGYERGRPVDRYYIERFLAAHAPMVRGRVLEIADNGYTRQFGGQRVTRSDVLHVSGSARATIVGDLAADPPIASASFDCIICTQTLQFIYDVRAAVRTLYRILAPGGTLLVSVAGVGSQISRHDMEQWGDYWRFTTRSARRLFGEAFPSDRVEVAGHGNVLATVAFLHGLAEEELGRDELDRHDADYELVVTVAARKPEDAP